MRVKPTERKFVAFDPTFQVFYLKNAPVIPVSRGYSSREQSFLAKMGMGEDTLGAGDSVRAPPW